MIKTIKLNFLLFFIIAIFILLSCNSKNSSSQDESITNRIQYDVILRDTNQNAEWWINNLEGSVREKLIKDIFKKVYDYEIDVYDYYSLSQLTDEQLNSMIKQVDSISYESPNPPYHLIDTVIVKQLHLQDITKLRFLEEWSLNHKTLEIKKKVLGICPMVERYNEDGSLRGYKPLFWIFMDDRYPDILKIN